MKAKKSKSQKIFQDKWDEIEHNAMVLNDKINDNKTLGSLARKKPEVKKPRSMAKILNDAKICALGNRFVVKIYTHHYKDGKKVSSKKEHKFSLFKFMMYCRLLFKGESNNYGIIIAKMAMEQIDPKFNRNNPTKFRGMDCIN